MLDIEDPATLISEKATLLAQFGSFAGCRAAAVAMSVPLWVGRSVMLNEAVAPLDRAPGCQVRRLVLNVAEPMDGVTVTLVTEREKLWVTTIPWAAAGPLFVRGGRSGLWRIVSWPASVQMANGSEPQRRRRFGVPEIPVTVEAPISTACARSNARRTQVLPAEVR